MASDPPKFKKVSISLPFGIGSAELAVDSTEICKNFDVFLAHSSKDKPLIRQLYRQLQERGIQPWLDEEEIAPGTRFQDEIQLVIGQIKTAAICIGQGGLGRWQAIEIQTFISQCVERNIPVIPVLLPEVERIPENLLFLQTFHAVFFRVGIDDEQALSQLEWGITGNKPKRPVATNKVGSQQDATVPPPTFQPEINEVSSFARREANDYNPPKDPMKIIKIFLASSSELKSDREQFEIFINRKNKDYINKGLFLELVLWEDFIDAMSATRLQDEYNKAITDCDIFVSLFHSKVGKYTEEEFLRALVTFQANKKPLIYTYFKDEAIKLSEKKHDDIVSLFDFQKKLSDLGHYPTIYNNIEDLKYRFSEQLNKILP